VSKFPIHCEVTCEFVDKDGQESYDQLVAVLDFGSSHLTREDLWITIQKGPTGYETAKAYDILHGAIPGDEWVAYKGGVGKFRKLTVLIDPLLEKFWPPVNLLHKKRNHDEDKIEAPTSTKLYL
jgi:hypothetical protein